MTISRTIDVQGCIDYQKLVILPSNVTIFNGTQKIVGNDDTIIFDLMLNSPGFISTNDKGDISTENIKDGEMLSTIIFDTKYSGNIDIYIIGCDTKKFDKSSMMMKKISKGGQHDELETDGSIVCKTESYMKKYVQVIHDKQYKLMEILYRMNICPRPISLDELVVGKIRPMESKLVVDTESTICMEHGGIDFDEKISHPGLEGAMESLITSMSATRLLFIDLCLQFNSGNIVYKDDKVRLIDIDLKLILLVKDMPTNYWKEILTVYKEFVTRTEEDEEFEGGDPYDFYQDKLDSINNQYLPAMTFSQTFYSYSLTADDITPELLMSDENKLFGGKKINQLFHGRFNTKAYYTTITPEMFNMGMV